MSQYTGKQAFELANTIHSILQRGVEGTSFNLRCNFNLKKLDTVIDPVKKLHQDNPKMAEYQQKRQSTIIGFATKDESGNPIVTNNNINISDVDACNAALKSIDDEYATEITVFNEAAKAVDEFLNEPFDISTLKKIKESYIPPNLTSQEVKVLQDIVELD